MIIVGLRAEARIARALGVTVAVGGGTAAGAEGAARHLVARGAKVLISFGLAGALDPAIPAGMIVVPHTVIAEGTRFAADESLARRLGGPTTHVLLGAASVAMTPSAKQRLWRETGASAVDLESSAVARVAAGSGLPFAVLRAVCDTANHALPPAALVALDSDGVVGLLRVGGSVLAFPGQIPALLMLAADAARARRALKQRVRQISLAEQ
jgi:adenosylhomocysteine nucleosidase